ncbi:SseB family protein [Dermacoccaceae bacterium W4C1]
MVGPQDSAGTPWQGRSLPGGGFDGDDGSADPALQAALAGGDERTVLRLLAQARLLVPVVAAPAEDDPLEKNDAGLVVEKQTDMAVVTLTAQDGQRALPVFTSMAAMAAWDPSARPTPVNSGRAAQAAVAEQCHLIALDIADEHAYTLRPSMVWALAQQREWLPAHEDPQVRAAFEEAVRDRHEVVEVTCEDGGEPGVLRATLTLLPGLDSAGVQELVTEVAEKVAADAEVRARIDALAFGIRSA